MSARQPTQTLDVPFLISSAKYQWKVDLDTEGSILLQLVDPVTGKWTTRHKFERDGDMLVHGVSSDGVIF